MKTYRANNIQWETEGQRANTPKTITFRLKDDEDPAVRGFNALFKITGRIANKFNYKQIRD